MDDAGEVTDEARDAALGRHLRALRRQRGWTQTTLSEKSGVSEASIRSIEGNNPAGRRRSRSTLTALAQGLGLPGGYLISYRDSPPPEELRSQAEARQTVFQQSALDVIARSVQETTALVNETVIPRLARLERQLDMITAALYPGANGARVEAGNPGGDDKE